METFDEWWDRAGNPEVSGHNHVAQIARAAFESAKAQSGNYTVDDEVFPRRIQFGNGKIVIIRERTEDPDRFYLGVGTARE